MSPRGQSDVVGVALLLAVTVVSLGALTASVGVVVDDAAATADARRVATALDDAVRPLEHTGVHRGRVSFTEGRLSAVDRDLRVLDGDAVVRRVRAGALVFEGPRSRVALVAGAVVRGRPGNAVLHDPPPVTAGEGVLVVGAPRLNATGAAAGTGVDVVLRTNVSHDRESLGEGTYSVAVETATPGPFERHFAARGATVSRRDVDGDGVPSVVAAFPGERVAYLVVHDVRLEVGRG